MSTQTDARPKLLNASRYFKTKLCVRHMTGRCNRGDYCQFSHDQRDLRPMPNLAKTSICKAWKVLGACGKGDECPYAHGQEELRATCDMFKKNVCFMWLRGKCKSGDRCRHAHGNEERYEYQRLQILEGYKVVESVPKNFPLRRGPGLFASPDMTPRHIVPFHLPDKHDKSELNEKPSHPPVGLAIVDLETHPVTPPMWRRPVPRVGSATMPPSLESSFKREQSYLGDSGELKKAETEGSNPSLNIWQSNENFTALQLQAPEEPVADVFSGYSQSASFLLPSFIRDECIAVDEKWSTQEEQEGQNSQ